MRRLWKRWLSVLLVLLAATSGLLFHCELDLRYRVGQTFAALPNLAGASFLVRRSFADAVCGSAGTIALYATERPWEEV